MERRSVVVIAVLAFGFGTLSGCLLHEFGCARQSRDWKSVVCQAHTIISAADVPGVPDGKADLRRCVYALLEHVRPQPKPPQAGTPLLYKPPERKRP